MNASYKAITIMFFKAITTLLKTIAPRTLWNAGAIRQAAEIIRPIQTLLVAITSALYGEAAAIPTSPLISVAPCITVFLSQTMLMLNLSSTTCVLTCSKVVTVNALIRSHTSTLCTRLNDEHGKPNSSTLLRVAAHTTHRQGSRAHRSGQNTVDSHHIVPQLGHNSHPDISTHQGDTLINGITQASP
ncbi:hypothetical protein E2C01_024324 [Portunus trituberculatus]|uniref:Uncharacterized protein n=1 Tax=Portunus trituberculatus TaxID=210409 RepID=A0A5B7ECI9_PORTR|nr:hypothetical protein [Portunus trituberculatus]